MPFYRFHLDTALPEPAAFERVREFTRPRRTFRESIGIALRRDHAAGPPFLGTLGPSSFRLRRDIRYRNSFLPLIWGRIVPSPRGSRINVTMFLHPLVAVFMIIWFSGLGYALAKLWVHRKEAVPFAVLIPAAMFLFGVALVLVCFIPEAIKAKRLLESAFDASNLAREQTAIRRTIQLHMTSNQQSAATLAPARGSLSWTRQMQSSRMVGLIALTAIGMFLLSMGIDSLKVAHLGIKFVPVLWLAATLPLSYHTIGVIFVVLGFSLMLIAAEVCRRADKHVVARFPGISSPGSFRFVLVPAAFIAFVGWWIANGWFRT
jgi:hypothetical protein